MTDIVKILQSWDRCYPGNINLSLSVELAAAEITRLRAENENLQHKLHDAIVKYQRLLMQYEPEKAAGLADATFKGDDNVG